jgi:triosephosphate isomerase
MASHKPLIAGNWKMNLNHLEAIGLVQKLAFALPEKYFDEVDVAVLPPFTDLRSVQTVVEGDGLRIGYGAQDVSTERSGAYTGEVAAPMLAKLGCTYVTVGHSERREHHGETDELVGKKARAVSEHQMCPIVCIGEPVEVREAGDHVAHCRNQLRTAVEWLATDAIASQLVVAYEPVWAIGTGRVATPADAQEVCGALRAALGEQCGTDRAGAVRLLYGGSVKASNIAELAAQEDVDGALVGGASLDADEFAELCALAAGGPLP